MLFWDWQKRHHQTCNSGRFRRTLLREGFSEKRGFVAVKETDGSENEEREPDVLYRWQRTERTSIVSD